MYPNPSLVPEHTTFQATMVDTSSKMRAMTQEQYICAGFPSSSWSSSFIFWTSILLYRGQPIVAPGLPLHVTRLCLLASSQLSAQWNYHCYELMKLIQMNKSNLFYCDHKPMFCLLLLSSHSLFQHTFPKFIQNSQTTSLFLLSFSLFILRFT